MARKRQERSVTLMVDAENIPARYFPQAFEAARALGRISEVRIYGTPTLMGADSWRVVASAYGATQVNCPGCKSGKNSADIRLVIDAMDMMAARRPGTFVIMSDDSDFASLASRLRKSGARVVGVGLMTRNDKYRSAFDDFLTVSDDGIVHETKKIGGKKALSPAAIEDASTKTGIDSDVLATAVKCAKRCAHKDDWCALPEFGSRLYQMRPGFSSKHYGCKNLTAFVEKTELFESKKVGQIRFIRPKAA